MGEPNVINGCSSESGSGSSQRRFEAPTDRGRTKRKKKGNWRREKRNRASSRQTHQKKVDTIAGADDLFFTVSIVVLLGQGWNRGR